MNLAVDLRSQLEPQFAWYDNGSIVLFDGARDSRSEEQCSLYLVHDVQRRAYRADVLHNRVSKEACPRNGGAQHLSSISYEDGF